uniref:Differentially expressed in FDCP 8 A n=1 Tax=Aceria tosichella TaxID=561515 RepID=A0A6G1SA26_9ACAR
MPSGSCDGSEENTRDDQSLISSSDIMCNGHRFVKSTLFQTPGYLADLSPYISAVISSRLLATPIQITANAIRPLGPLATSILPARATNYILSGTLTCEYCLHQVSQDSFNDGRICPSLLLERLHISSESNFVLAEQLLEAQERRSTEHKKNQHDANYYIDELLIMKITPEIGLHAQGFACINCDKRIDLNSSRLCNYDGRYYCYSCHTGSDLVPIPARVLRNWDFTPKPVSKSSLQKVCFLRTKPVFFNLFQTNSTLYGFLDRLVEIKQIREQIQLMLKYLAVCGQPNKPHLSTIPKHFLEPNLLNYFTLDDLLDINHVYDLLNGLQASLEQHIVKQCESCRGKGFYCELCKDPHDVLYPFSKNSGSCQKCQTVYHKNCFHRKKKNCPKCQRLSLKSKMSTPDSGTAMSHESLRPAASSGNDSHETEDIITLQYQSTGESEEVNTSGASNALGTDQSD